VHNTALQAQSTTDRLRAMGLKKLTRTVGRIRLVGLLLPKRRARPAVPGWPVPFGRWRRLAQRWLAVIIEHAPPRGAGVAAAALLLLGSLSYGVIRGEHTPAIAARVQQICDAVANAAGFGISEIALSGEHDVSREEILTTAGITGSSSLLFLDAAQARARLLTNPWIADAAVLKLYPSRLRIEIKERKPFALWQKDDRVSVIAADGTVLEPFVPRRFLTLPLVVGVGAQHAALGFLAELKRYPAVARLVEASVLVADRRWNLYLKGGIEVQLPEAEPARALRRLVELDRAKHLLSRDIVKVDLRLGDRVTVRLSDDAAAARDAALKAAADKDKKKKKGSEA
jgi:cell division protein FtsQ